MPPIPSDTLNAYASRIMDIITQCYHDELTTSDLQGTVDAIVQSMWGEAQHHARLDLGV